MASDHGGFRLKEAIKTRLIESGHHIVDVGANSELSVDYPAYGRKAAELVAGGQCERAIVVCSTGIGISIAANKVRGIRAALCADLYTAQLTRQHNDTNVLALGQNVIGTELGIAIAEMWLSTPFSCDERHQRRIDAIEVKDA